MLGASLAVYSWASERMPWLVLHPLLPLALLAGIGAQTLWSGRSAVAAKLALAVLALGGATSVAAAVTVSYVRPADPRELLVQVQTSTDVPGVRDELVRLESLVTRTTGKPLSLEVDTWGGTGWPWGWYLRNLPAAYLDMSDASYVPAGQAVLVADPNHAAVAPRLGGYVGRRFRLRVWWVPDWGRAGPADWLRWLVSRRAWSPTATMDEWLYLRPEVARLLNRT
jgi:predicted membrane-bound mannosyltransferase